MRLAVALLIAFALARVAVTLRTFSATVDEATHIGAGLEMYQQHRYHFHRHNPPLPRIVLAAVPYAIGMRVDLSRDVYGQVLSVFYSEKGGTYERKLAASRAGNLLFVALSCIGLWLYARAALGEREAVVALVLFTTQPIVLGYSGLVTHDIAATGATAFALAAFLHWIRDRSWRWAALMGVAYGVSVLCKFSCIAFVPAGCLVIFLVRTRTLDQLKAILTQTLIVPVVAALVIWAGYGFSIGHVSDLAEYAGAFGARGEHLITRIDPQLPLPASQFFTGIALMQVDRGTFPQYLFGHVSREGWWWYFPAAIVLKTPIPFLLLLLLGAAVTWRSVELRGVYVESVLAAAIMVILATNSHLDLGVRYVLPAYAPLTIAATAAVAAMRQRMRIVAAALVAAQVIISLAIHPDYFPYFNALAGRDPSRYLIDSNLDWGQDVLRLRAAVRAIKAERIAIRDSGLIDFTYLGFPPNRDAAPDVPATGWVAVGDHPYRMGEAAGGYGWLRGRSYRRIGKSIRLYRIGGDG